jgi:hypothetical protein
MSTFFGTAPPLVDDLADGWQGQPKKEDADDRESDVTVRVHRPRMRRGDPHVD